MPFKNQEKDAAWQKISIIFNAKGINVFRDVESLRKQWSNIEQETKNVVVRQRSELYKTGGGPAEDIETSYDLILPIINSKIVVGLENENDSDRFIEQGK